MKGSIRKICVHLRLEVGFQQALAACAFLMLYRQAKRIKRVVVRPEIHASVGHRHAGEMRERSYAVSAGVQFFSSFRVQSIEYGVNGLFRALL